MYLGHDAEFAVLVDGKPVAAHRFYPPKTDPVFTHWSDAEAYHRDQFFRDGTSLEVNTPGGMTCIGSVLNSTAQTLKVAAKRLPKGGELQAMSVYDVEGSELKGAPVDVLESGCSPVKNAYGKWEDKALFMDPKSTERYAGGHIHIAPYHNAMEILRDEKQRERFCKYVVRYLDLYLAVPLLYTKLEGDNGNRRRKVYGKAGEFRFQTYLNEEKPWGVPQPGWKPPVMHGIEYRVLGPEWLKDPGTAGLTFMLARAVTNRAIEKYKEGKAGLPSSALMKAARKAINDGNVDSVFESTEYQKRLKTMLARMTRQATVEDLKFIRENPQLFKKTIIHTFAYELHNNWPEARDRWKAEAAKPAKAAEA